MPKLSYFNIRGRVEPIRLLLADLGVDYEDHRPGRRWRALKPTMPFGQLPAWTRDDGRVITQSQAILRHLGREHGLMGGSEDELVRIEEAQEAWVALFEKLLTLFWAEDFEAARPKLEERVKRRLPQLEAHLLAGGGPYWLGEQPAVVDYLAWYVLDCLRAYDPALLEPHPALARLKASLAARPRVAAYLDSPGHARTIAPPSARFGGTPETS